MSIRERIYSEPLSTEELRLLVELMETARMPSSSCSDFPQPRTKQGERLYLELEQANEDREDPEDYDPPRVPELWFADWCVFGHIREKLCCELERRMEADPAHAADLERAKAAQAQYEEQVKAERKAREQQERREQYEQLRREFGE